MGVFSQRRQNKQKTKQKTKLLGFVFCAVSFLLTLFTVMFPPFSKLVYATLGYFSYVIFALLLLVGLVLLTSKKYYVNKQHLTMLSLVIVCLVCILQICFSAKTINALGTISCYGEYLKVLTQSNSAGGVVFGVIVYPFASILGVVGSVVLFSILLLVFGGIVVDNIASSKLDKNANRPVLRRTMYDDAVSIEDDRTINFAPDKSNEKVNQNNIPYDYYNGIDATKQYTETDEDEYSTDLAEEITEAPTNLVNNGSFDFFRNNKQNSQRTSHDEAREMLFGNLSNRGDEDDVNDEEDTIKTGELTYEQKLERLRQKPDMPVFPDPFRKNNYATSSEEDSTPSNSSYNTTETISGFNNLSMNDDYVEQSVKDGNDTKNEDSLYAPNDNNERFKVGQQIQFTGPTNPVEHSKFESSSRRNANYVAPPITLLKTISDDPSKYGGDYQKNSQVLEDTLNTFKISAKVINVVRGPSVTRYELMMPVGIPVKNIFRYESDIQSALCAKSGVRIEAPIPGKNAVGVELPNNPRSMVGFREIVESKEFSSSTAALPVAIGKNITGEVIVKSLDKMVHMLIAGSTGSGKSIFLHSLIVSLMYKQSPDYLKFIMIDPKRVEFPVYNGMPHMLIPNTITDPDKAINAFAWAVLEMDRRYKLLEAVQCRDIKDYNSLPEVKKGKQKPMPYLVLVVDELAELMSINKKEIEEKIRRISQLGRACGIHLVIATQRPSVDVITGTIKANLPTRVACTLSNIFDSKTILDEPGAEKLLGQGDMLFLPQDSNDPVRLQGAFISNSEIKEIVQYVKDNNVCDFDEEMEAFISKKKEQPGDAIQTTSNGEPKEREEDEFFKEALKYIIERKRASTSMLQTKFYIGFNRASRLIAQFENLGYIGEQNGAKPREVLITLEQYYDIYGRD